MGPHKYFQMIISFAFIHPGGLGIGGEDHLMAGGPADLPGVIPYSNHCIRRSRICSIWT